MDITFKALADANRRQLLDRLRIESGQTLSELCMGLKMSRQAVTKHLKMLEQAQLVVTVKQGREKLHYLNAAPINEVVSQWIEQFKDSQLATLPHPKVVEGESNEQGTRDT